MIEIHPYEENMIADWENVLSSATSGNFLYSRRYIDYHGNRFNDASLLIKKKNKIIGIFPAAMIDQNIISHPGITFGGLITTSSLHASETFSLLDKVKSYYKGIGANQLIYKALPYIFYDYPCQEDLYTLNVMGAILFRRDLSSAIKICNKIKFSKGKVWSINKSIKQGVTIHQANNLERFYLLLSNTLKKYQAKPTHSIEELKDLFHRFSENISLFEATINDSLLAGAIVYDYGDVVHTQYLACSEEGKKIGCLDHLIHYLINDTFSEKKYFSFGISTEDSGNFLNEGLVSFKESFGARGVAHDFYKLKL